LFWQNPDCGLEQDILNGYLVGGAWKSAAAFIPGTRHGESRRRLFKLFGTAGMDASVFWRKTKS